MSNSLTDRMKFVWLYVNETNASTSTYDELRLFIIEAFLNFLCSVID